MQEKSQYKILINTSKRNIKEVQLVRVSKTQEIEIIENLTDCVDVVQGIKDLLERANIGIGTISEFIPNTGPTDTFTGLKTGITIANVLNFTNGTCEKVYTPNYGAEPNIQVTAEVIK